MYKLLALTFAAAFFTSSSFAAPRAQSAQECAIAADMALVAQALAREQIEPAKAGAIMTRIYDVSESDRGKEMMRSILDAAYTRNAKFADELLNECMASGGNMDAVLGKSV
jgi:lipopolysaccharide export LptBFGC system permease protein LptF